MTGLLAYLKRVLWRFLSSLGVAQIEPKKKVSEFSVITYRFQPHASNVQWRIRGLGSVVATNVPFNGGLACCLLSSLGVEQI